MVNTLFLDSVLKEILSLLPPDASSSDVQRIKTKVAKKYHLKSLPRNSELLAAAPQKDTERYRRILLVKPARTLSGVAPVAVMTSPHPCPHGKCLPCPGGPDHPFNSPQSYTGEEPAALRGRQHAYDPFSQVTARLRQFEELGHHINKVELIVMGGTMTARDPEYQQWFMAECLRAMNSYGSETVTASGERSYEELCTDNESTRARCIGATFETRPDYCGREEIDRMLRLGITKVELGFQHNDDAVLDYNRRGHDVACSVETNRLLRDAGMKVGFHVMPNLPSATLEGDRRMFEALFTDPRFRPDFLKIYPTLVTPGSEIEALWKAGGYTVYDEDKLIDLIAYGKSLLPEYVRLQRVQRDIPAKLITAGSRHSNFRQLCKNRLVAEGGVCRCIRCREAGRQTIEEEPVIEHLTYDCAGGTEHFISAVAGDALIGFIRLRFPADPWRPECEGAALIRELHVYGSLVPVAQQAGTSEWQHRDFGKRLLAAAEVCATDADFSRMVIMSGIGVRPYYLQQGYCREGPYMVKEMGSR